MIEVLGCGSSVSIRKLIETDLQTLANFEYSVSITEPHSDVQRLRELLETTGMWQAESGAVAITENTTSKLLGTLQFYRSAPCIHGLEIGYVVHDPGDRGKGYAGQALKLLTDLLFDEKVNVHRLQLTIAVWNTASWRVAERCGFLREGMLRSCGFDAQDPEDCFIYSKTRRDFRTEKASSNGSL